MGAGAARELGVTSFDARGGRSAGNIAHHALAGTAGAMANAATRSAINGESFGDNLMRALPDAIANTVGNLVADGIAGNSGGGAANGSARDEIVVNPDAIRSAGMGSLSGNSDLSFDDLLQQRIADTSARNQAEGLLSLAGGDLDLARSMLVAGYLGQTAPSSGSDNGFQSELVRNSYAATSSQAMSYFEMRGKEA